MARRISQKKAIQKRIFWNPGEKQRAI